MIYLFSNFHPTTTKRKLHNKPLSPHPIQKLDIFYGIRIYKALHFFKLFADFINFVAEEKHFIAHKKMKFISFIIVIASGALGESESIKLHTYCIRSYS